MNVKEHYENHLGSFYSWMLGDFEARQAEQEAYFAKNCIFPKSNKIALDLGAGNGIQAVSLAKLGFSVKAIDFTSQLTSEISAHSHHLDIEVITGDFTDSIHYLKFSPELIVCMGDTITHLDSTDHIDLMLKNAYRYSESNAVFIVSFRDLTKELTDEQRFIPVRADENRILTCFLEYFPDYVKVTDILHERHDNQWIQKVSCYQKLRLNTEMLRNLFARNNFHLMDVEMIKGLNYLIFRKK
jgi:hypothetical protein